MKAYTFFKIDREADVPSFEIEHFDSDTEARRHAYTLLGETRYVAIEIWDGQDAKRINRFPVTAAPLLEKPDDCLKPPSSAEAPFSL